jgi:hypothetical protein
MFTAVGVVGDQGIAGVTPEPRAGFRTARARDNALEAFSSAVWQRHTASHRSNPQPWPSTSTFHRNMPHIAFDLIVAAWKIDELETEQLQRPPSRGSEREHWLFGTSTADSEQRASSWYVKRQAAVATSELDEELLDPKPPVERDARQVYAAELAAHPAILGDLDRGGAQDGVELVLERAQLSTRERLVVRPWLNGDDSRTIAAQLGMRPQSVVLMLSNARKRLEDVRSWARPRGARSLAQSVVGASEMPQMGDELVAAAREGAQPLTGRAVVTATTRALSSRREMHPRLDAVAS